MSMPHNSVTKLRYYSNFRWNVVILCCYCYFNFTSCCYEPLYSEKVINFRRVKWFFKKRKMEKKHNEKNFYKVKRTKNSCLTSSFQKKIISLVEKKVNETKKNVLHFWQKKVKKKKKIISKVNNQCDCMDTGGQRFVMKILENAWHYKEEEWNGKQFLMDWRGTVLKILHHLQARICKVSVCNFSPLNHGSRYNSLEDGKSRWQPL